MPRLQVRRRAAEAEAPAEPILRRAWDQIAPIGLAVLIALAIRAVIIESYYVPSGSMLMLIGSISFPGPAAPLRPPYRFETRSSTITVALVSQT